MVATRAAPPLQPQLLPLGIWEDPAETATYSSSGYCTTVNMAHYPRVLRVCVGKARRRRLEID